MSSAKRKHIKKNLMSRGLSRNAADTVAGAIMFSSHLRSFMNNKVEHAKAERRKNAIHFLGYADSDRSVLAGNDDQLRKDGEA